MEKEISEKIQRVPGSIDEKTQTCAFKLRQYRRIFAPLNIDVPYIYLFNDWFLKREYRDMLDFIIDAGCFYYLF